MPSYYLIPKKLVDRLPFLRKTVWWLESVFFRSMFFLARLLPQKRASALLSGIFARLGPMTGKSAKVSRNLQFVIPQLRTENADNEVREVFANLGRAMTELVFIDRIWQDSKQLEFKVYPETAAILSAGKPAVLVTAHVGAWQLTSLIGAHFEFPLATIYARETNPYLEKFFYRLRSGFQSRLVASEGGIRQLVKLLREGCSVGLAVDTRLDKGEPISFFGVPTPTNTVPARLALSTNVPLIPVRGQRLPNGRFRITAYPPVASGNAALGRDEKTLSMTAQLNAHFEQWIREEPTQWMCLKRRWPKDAQPCPAQSTDNKLAS